MNMLGHSSQAAAASWVVRLSLPISALRSCNSLTSRLMSLPLSRLDVLVSPASAPAALPPESLCPCSAQELFLCHLSPPCRSPLPPLPAGPSMGAGVRAHSRADMAVGRREKGQGHLSVSARFGRSPQAARSGPPGRVSREFSRSGLATASQLDARSHRRQPFSSRAGGYPNTLRCLQGVQLRAVRAAAGNCGGAQPAASSRRRSLSARILLYP